MRANKNERLVEGARHFAAGAHAAVGQLRKFTGEPFIVHPAAVVELVSRVEHTPEMLAAAWLHDTVEDTNVTVADIECHFGHVVATLVDWLTDPSRPEHGNRATRKKIDLIHLEAAPAEAQTIKLADLIDNTSTIVKHDPKFAKVFLAEKLLLLGVLQRGNRILRQHASQVARQGLERLGVLA